MHRFSFDYLYYLDLSADLKKSNFIIIILEQFASDADLKDIDAVAFELRNIRAQQQKVVKLSFGTLNQGVINENMIQTTTALQVIFEVDLL